MSTYLKRRRRPEINIVPLLDVFIVLIFFFVMTMQFNNQSVLNITPPKAETAGKNKATDDIVIAVDTDGVFFFNSTPVTEEQLLEAIKVQASVDKERFVLVIADEDSALKHVTYIMDACRKHGLEKLRLQTR